MAALLWYVTPSILLFTIRVRSVSIAKSVYVDASGGGDFATVQAAISSVPDNNAQWIRIHVKAGTYR